MKNLIHEEVVHVSYGKGEVSQAEGSFIFVEFSACGEKRFLYPDAFGEFLTLCDDKRMEEVTREYRQAMSEREQEKLRHRQEKEEERQRLLEEKKPVTKRKAAAKPKAAK